MGIILHTLIKFYTIHAIRIRITWHSNIVYVIIICDPPLYKFRVSELFYAHIVIQLNTIVFALGIML